MNKKKLSNTEIGILGENLAVKYLQNLNYKVLDRNWRFKKAEIDIIAKHKEILIFIEVKTKSYTFYGQPEEAINDKKEAMLIDAAQRYMENIDYNWEIRFDIISIVLNNDLTTKELKHFIDAFF